MTTPLEDARAALSQVIANSLYAMQAGEFPDPALQPEPNSGDMQLASDLQEAGYALIEGPITDEWEEHVEYGHVIDGIGWVFEPRGKNYAMYQRAVKAGPPKLIKTGDAS